MSYDLIMHYNIYYNIYVKTLFFILIRLIRNGLEIMLEYLKKNSNIVYIYNNIIVKYICEKKIILNKKYKKINLTRYVKNSCNLKNKQPKIINFFKYTSNLNSFSRSDEFDKPIEILI